MSDLDANEDELDRTFIENPYNEVGFYPVNFLI